MAHITVPEGVPGIVGPMMAFPNTARHLNGLAEELLRGPSSLTQAEREVIATFVSSRNECTFCMNAHAATARHLLGSERGLVDQVIADSQRAPIDAKMKALLAIADKVRQGGRRVTDDDVARARREGADDNAIHHAVLTAAAFCMYNRYVDGLATSTPTDQSLYAQVGAHLAETGYLRPVNA